MSDRNISRRKFLKMSALTVAGATVTCCGVGGLASLSPNIETHNLTYGKENQMTKNVLVTYATKAGSTAEIAGKIGEHLYSKGLTVDVVNVKSNPDPGKYDCVILGSCIRMGNWLPDMLEFVKTHQSTIQSKQYALFTVHMLNSGEDETSLSARLAYLDKVRELLPDGEEVFFLGEMDFSKLSLLDRFISKMVKAEESDLRDWDQIQQWSESLEFANI